LAGQHFSTSAFQVFIADMLKRKLQELMAMLLIDALHVT